MISSLPALEWAIFIFETDFSGVVGTYFFQIFIIKHRQSWVDVLTCCCVGSAIKIRCHCFPPFPDLLEHMEVYTLSG